ncbi:GDSL-type esterase/lipase family protein (plasmid) [Vibrio cyclitrophicus]
MNKLSGSLKNSKGVDVAKVAILMALIFVSFSYGFLANHYKIFPYEQIRNVKVFMGVTNDCKYCGANPEWPERLEQFRIFPSKAINVMVGDSITHSGLWKEIFPNYSIVNRGVGWDKTTDVLNRLDTIFSVEPRRVFLMMGVNDFNLASRNVTDVFEVYTKIIDAIRQRKIDVVIQSTLECANCGTTIEKIRKLNRMLENYANESHITFIDINSSLSGESGLKPSFQLDGVHPNAEGYKRWASILKPYLLKESG